MFPFVGRSGAAEAFDLRVVGPPGCSDLCVAVDDGAACPPETVPHKEGVVRLGVDFEGLAAPFQVVEDDEAVETVVLGDVRSRGRVLTLHTAEDVGRRAFLWVAEWVSLGRRYLAVEV